MEVIKFLIEECCIKKINSIDSCGRTPYDNAIYESEAEIAKYLKSKSVISAYDYRLNKDVKNIIHLCEKGKLNELKQ